MPLAPHVLVELSKREVAARVDRTEQRCRCRRRLRLFRLAAVAFGVGDAQPAQVDERKKRRGELLRYMGLQRGDRTWGCSLELKTPGYLPPLVRPTRVGASRVPPGRARLGRPRRPPSR